MTQTMTAIGALGQRIDQINDKVRKACSGIAAELEKPLPQNSARITAFMHDITALVRDMTRLLPQLDRANAEVSAEADRIAAEQGQKPGRLPPEWYALRTRAERLRTQMNQWHEVQHLIRAQVPPRRVPLHIPVEDRTVATVTQSDATDALFGLLHKMLNPLGQDEAARSHGCYPDIVLSNATFMMQVHAAYRVFLARQHRQAPRFVDVGCGSGFKVLSAALFFGRAEGIEYDQGYASLAQKILDRAGNPDSRILQADALTFDAYADYDIIYFFRPMRDDTLMRKLERRIVETATPGTILIAPYIGFSQRQAQLGCPNIAGDLYLCAASQDDAADLRTAAEYIGASISRRESPLSSIWEPILEASHRKGYGTRLTKPFPV